MKSSFNFANHFLNIFLERQQPRIRDQKSPGTAGEKFHRRRAESQPLPGQKSSPPDGHQARKTPSGAGKDPKSAESQRADQNEEREGYADHEAEEEGGEAYEYDEED